MRLELFLDRAKMIGIFIGRMSPPTIAHQKIINQALSKYEEVYVFIIEGMQTSLLTKNFLTFEQRKQLLHITNPEVKPILGRSGYLPEIIKENHINTAHGIAIVAGTDRIDNYMAQFKKEDYSVIADEIKRSEEDVSASKLRDALLANNFSLYKRMVARGLNNEKHFAQLRKLLIKKQKEVREDVWNLFGGLKKLYEGIKNLFGGKSLSEEHVNKHIEHYEDNVFNYGLKGIKQNIVIANSIKDILNGNSKEKMMVTVKWDGAPAVFFGKNPEDGKFFVSTKSIFSVTPKIGRTDKEIEENFGHAPALVNKLKTCLKHLSKLGVDRIYQGDLLFTDGRKNEIIDGIEYITFTPNTITYAVPDDDSELSKKIKKASMGIVIHTEYSGDNLQSLNATFNVDVKKYMSHSDVWVQDAYIKDISGIVNLTTEEENAINSNLEIIGSLSGKIDPGFFGKMKDSKIGGFLDIFHNAYIKGEGKSIENPHKYYVDFVAWINTKYANDVEKLKLEKAKEAKKIERDSILSFLKTYKDDLVNAMTIYSLFIKIKLVFIRRFEKIDNIKSLLRSENGYKVAKPEGFCVIDNRGNILKLVDRLEFSRANFLLTKNW